MINKIKFITIAFILAIITLSILPIPSAWKKAVHYPQSSLDPYIDLEKQYIHLLSKSGSIPSLEELERKYPFSFPLIKTKEGYKEPLGGARVVILKSGVSVEKFDGVLFQAENINTLQCQRLVNDYLRAVGKVDYSATFGPLQINMNLMKIWHELIRDTHPMMGLKIQTSKGDERGEIHVDSSNETKLIFSKQACQSKLGNKNTNFNIAFTTI